MAMAVAAALLEVRRPTQAMAVRPKLGVSIKSWQGNRGKGEKGGRESSGGCWPRRAQLRLRRQWRSAAEKKKNGFYLDSPAQWRGGRASEDDDGVVG